MALEKNIHQTQKNADSNLEMLRQTGWPVDGGSSLPSLIMAIAVTVILIISFVRLGLPAATTESVHAVRTFISGQGSSQVVDSAQRFLEQAWPPVISRERETSRIEGFDSTRLPLLSRLETRETPIISIDVVDDAIVEREVMQSHEVLVEPYGYLFRIAGLMLETFEIAIWGTLLAMALGMPLSLLGSRRTSLGPPVRYATQALCSFSRAVPELISALFFVLLFGFGSTAGVLALGLHSAGFLGKFFADDIDNTHPGPAQALASSGIGTIGVFRHAILPQVFPQYLAYVQYILERNVRAATVLGVVGAGGIGVELMGKWHNFQYGHATTVLLTIFLTVVLLEIITQRVRKTLIHH